MHHKHFDYCRLGHYQEILVCHHEHPLARLAETRAINSNDLSEYRELVWGRMKDDDNDGFSSSYVVFADISSLIAMLKHNKGFAFLPADSVAALITSGQLEELSCDFELTAIARKVELCWRSGFTLCAIGRQVINTFKQHNQLNG